MLAKLTVRKSSVLVKNQKGITLIELLAVIVILGIIAAIAVPAIGGMISRSKINADVESLNLIQDAAIRYAMTESETGTLLLDNSAESLVSKGYLNSPPVAQSKSTNFFVSVKIALSGENYVATVYSDPGATDGNEVTKDKIEDGTVGD